MQKRVANPGTSRGTPALSKAHAGSHVHTARHQAANSAAEQSSTSHQSHHHQTASSSSLTSTPHLPRPGLAGSTRESMSASSAEAGSSQSNVLPETNSSRTSQQSNNEEQLLQHPDQPPALHPPNQGHPPKHVRAPQQVQQPCSLLLEASGVLVSVLFEGIARLCCCNPAHRWESVLAILMLDQCAFQTMQKQGER